MHALFINGAFAGLTETPPAAAPEALTSLPVPAALVKYIGTGWQDQGGALSLTPAALAQFRAALLARLAACRWEAQVRGVVVEGKRWHSDAEGRAALVEAVTLSRVWEETYPADRWQTRWKTADGCFIMVDRAAVIAAGLAVASHIQAVFAREATLSARIAEGDFEQLAALAAEIEGNW